MLVVWQNPESSHLSFPQPPSSTVVLWLCFIKLGVTVAPCMHSLLSAAKAACKATTVLPLPLCPPPPPSCCWQASDILEVCQNPTQSILVLYLPVSFKKCAERGLCPEIAGWVRCDHQDSLEAHQLGSLQDQPGKRQDRRVCEHCKHQNTIQRRWQGVHR